MKVCPNCQTSYPFHYTHCPRDGSSLIGDATWQEGTTIRGKYRILAKLGEGGMATVYKAMHMHFEELRALKVMNPELACDHAFVRRFTQEAILTRRIHHPNAVRVEDIDEAEDGRPFMVMEYLEGLGLKEVIEKQAPMAPARVSTIARQIASALSAAHRLGVVHRDVKPGNVFLISQGQQMGLREGGEQAKVLDFGIAKAREAHLDESLQKGEALTRTGNIIGTPTYMSPEQARGMRGGDLDGRSDIYSLGIVIYQMLTGGLPFKADTSVEWLVAHLQVPPTPLLEFVADSEIPPALAEAVMRCLEKDPNRRPATAETLIQDLERADWASSSANQQTTYLFSAQYDSRSAGRPDSLPRMMSTQDLAAPAPKRSRAWIGWMAGVALLLLIAGALFVWSRQRWIETPLGAAPAASQVQGQTSAPPGGSPTVDRGSNAAPVVEVEREPQPSAGQATPSVEKTSEDAPERPLTATNAAATQGAAPSSSPKRTAAPKPPGFAVALQRAKDDEGRGRFEDALQEYELALALDPSDTSLRRHIELLRARISKENDLIK